MAKITEYETSELRGSEVFVADQDGQTVGISAEEMKKYLGGSGSSVETEVTDFRPTVVGYVEQNPTVEAFHTMTKIADLKVGTYNVANWNYTTSDGTDDYIDEDEEKKINFKNFIDGSEMDFLCLQEATSWMDEKGTKSAYGYLLKGRFGIAMNSTERILCATHTLYDGNQYGSVELTIPSPISLTTKRRFSWIIANVEGKKVLIISAHLRNSLVTMSDDTHGSVYEREKELKEIFAFVQGKTWDYCIACGDFNTSNINGIKNGQHVEAYGQDWENLTSICNYYKFGMVNGGYLGWIKTYKEFSEKAHNSLDNILVSSNIRIAKIECDPKNEELLYSDHLPLVATLQLMDTTAYKPASVME